MKNFKSFILFTVVGIFAGLLVSCGNRNEKDIIALKKLSAERAEKSIKKFEDEYFMTEAIEKNGSVIFDAQIKDFKNTIKSRKADDQSMNDQSINKAVIETLIKNKIGLNFTFINDQKEKALFYSYGVKNPVPGMPDLPILIIKLGDKNIEAASPFLKETTFYLPSNGIGKFLALISPKDFFSFFNMDFSYTEMKNMMTMQLDRHSKKRYLNAEKALYKKADIKKTDSGYEITFNNEQLKQVPSLIWYALKNDNRLKLILSMYENVLTKEILDKFSENISPEKVTIPEDLRITEEISVKDGLISKDMFTVFLADKPLLEFSYEIEDYDYVLNNLNARIEFISEVDSSSYVVSLTSSGTSNENKAHFEINMQLTSNDYANDDYMDGEALLAEANYGILIDKTQPTDNFAALMSFAFPKMIPVYSDEGYNYNNMETMEMSVSGSFKKNTDSVEVGIDKISLNAPSELGGGSLEVELDSKMIMTNKIIKKIEIPKDRMNVLEMNSEDWTKIKDEFMMQLENLSKEYVK